MQAELIYNPYAGQAIVRRALADVVSYLEQYGWKVTIQETKQALKARALAESAARRGAEVVIAAGGDGTINEVANGLVGTEAALGVLPVGTTNVWATQMGIPALSPASPGARFVKLIADVEERMARPLSSNYYRKVLLDAARILVEGRIMNVDLGEVSGHYFLLWAGIGLDAAIAESMTVKAKRILGSWAYILSALEKFGNYTCTDVRLKFNGDLIESSTALIVVSNIQLYGGVAEIGARAYVNDGKLDVCVFKGDGFFTFVQNAVKVLAHQHLHDPNLEYFQCENLVIESARTLPVHLDGDPFSETPITIRAVPSALKVIVPRDVPSNLFK